MSQTLWMVLPSTYSTTTSSTFLASIASMKLIWVIFEGVFKLLVQHQHLMQSQKTHRESRVGAIRNSLSKSCKPSWLLTSRLLLWKGREPSVAKRGEIMHRCRRDVAMLTNTCSGITKQVAKVLSVFNPQVLPASPSRP
jgi:hypothetical protein